MTTYLTDIVEASYYAGFEIGSGIGSLKLVPVDAVELTQDMISLPAAYADGDVEQLVNGRGGLDAKLQKVLKDGEHVVSFQKSGTAETHTYFLGDLIKTGSNVRTGAGDPAKYYGPQAQAFLLALAAALIPERRFALRLVTALPVKLYQTKENRRKVKEALQGYYSFEYNGQQREAYIMCGTVLMEGQGVLIHCGSPNADQAVIDLGERTIDCIAATGQTLLTKYCNGEELGIGQLVDALQALAQKHEGKLSIDNAHKILSAYAHGEQLPAMYDGEGDPVAEREVFATIKEAKQRLWNSISSFVSILWTEDGSRVAADYNPVFLGGGGAYYFEKEFKDLIGKKTKRVKDAEFANILGYAELAAALEDRKADIWEWSAVNHG